MGQVSSLFNEIGNCSPDGKGKTEDCGKEGKELGHLHFGFDHFTILLLSLLILDQVRLVILTLVLVALEGWG